LICRRFVLLSAYDDDGRGAQVRSADDFEAVGSLIAMGLNDCAIARQTSIPRRTVWDWRYCKSPIRIRGAKGSLLCGIDHDFAGLPPAAYCYLLGLYLGDGCISRSGRVWRLRITLDDKYPGIIDRCREAINILMPGQRAATLRRSDHCIEVSLYSKHFCYLNTVPARST
ncbi:MAG: hypothetical protein WAO15_15100, partial [Mycobacterium sp.]